MTCTICVQDNNFIVAYMGTKYCMLTECPNGAVECAAHTPVVKNKHLGPFGIAPTRQGIYKISPNSVYV